MTNPLLKDWETGMKSYDSFSSVAQDLADWFRDLFDFVLGQTKRKGIVAPSLGVTRPIEPVESGELVPPQSDVEEAPLGVPAPLVDVEARPLTAYDVDAIFEKVMSLQKAKRGGAAYEPLDADVSQTYREDRYQHMVDAEGLELKAYKDHNGFRTVGVGFNLDAPGNKEQFMEVLGVDENFYNEVRDGKRAITNEQARMLLDDTVMEAEAFVQQKFKGVDLTAHERLALVSLAFNNPGLIGPNLTRLIREGDREGALEEILYRSNKNKNRGIARRRYMEARLFAGPMNVDALPDYKSYLKQALQA